jgi:RHH-type transcriptional regulator, proline utilization regulon repressor / proline dehydrogenase / delta 1-pyrroline-5-carboxylate dehydrogenase
MSASPRLPFPYRQESDVVSGHLQRLTTSASGASSVLDWAAAAQMAQPWVQAVRSNPPPFWAMESLLKEYPISSAEGLALMRLAEALLRVPDAQTAIELTADQLGRADFDAAGDGMMARLSASAIGMSKKFLPEGGQPSLMSKLGARSVVAATVRAVQLLGRQFVLGQTIADAMNEADDSRKKTANLRFSYDMLGEGARTDKDALAYLASYTSAINSIAARAHFDWACERNDGISIKLSALHPRYEDAQHARVMTELVPRVWGLCELAARANINLTIDAEEVDRLELSLDVFEALAAQVAQHHPQWQGFGLAMQAYQTRAVDLVEHVIALGRKYKLRLMCRLVKGAYWDSEIKRAQEMGLPHYPVFTHKHHTDVAYLACAQALLAAPDAVYPQFAGHNAGTIAAIVQMAARTQAPFELQRLHGMGEGVFREVLKNPAISCRVYAPVGAHRDLLAYLVRRLLENGANSSFVHQLADESVGMDVLLTSPLWFESRAAFPLPPALYGDARPNSAGLDLTVQSMRAPLLDAFKTVQVPPVPEFDAKSAASLMNTCASSYQKWSKIPVADRATALRKAADALEQQTPRFCALLVKEAFKTWGDAVSEVREAVDFLRYYANEAERIMAPVQLPGPTGETNELRLTARGVWVCISPWNFPLAIFMGQVAAALATGNAVVAKPAEQTPGVAWESVKLLHAAGVPQGALQLAHGPGETVGAALVAAPGVAGVVFTGSTQVAKIINRALAAKDGPITPLIAETGGINAMLVDSTALPEQVADAVVQSAFRSAGQRCSALRLLCVHEGIADAVIEMIEGAAAELTVGDPSALSTDVGPVIDREAFDNIDRHVKRLHSSSKVLLAQINRAPAATNSIATSLPNTVPPAAFEVASLAEVKDEIFGPVLQIVRWGSGALKNPEDVIAQINALGYGLTLGIQTRIDSRAQALAAAAHVGNIYINRNMIGAVVGVQPFGGEGLSGTGPKAGGPHYLYRFCAEQTVTVNTTAAGGNVLLMA